MAPTDLQTAYAEVDITPPLGGSMPGYFKDRRSTGVNDPLKAKVLLLRQGDERVALVTVDLIAMGAPLVEEIRQAVAKTLRPAPKHVWVHATHTHTAAMLPRNGTFTSDTEAIYPGFYPGEVDERWVREMVRKIAGGVAQASAALAPEKEVTWHEETEPSVAFYRRFLMKDGTVRTNPGRLNPEVVKPAGDIDPRLHVIRFPGSKTLMVMYSLHPDTVSGTLYSADYPAALTDAVRRDLGAAWNVLFLNACCGNINHINVADPNQKSGPGEAKRIGETLAAAVGRALKKPHPLKADRMVARSTQVVSRLRKPPPEHVREAEERLAKNDNPFGFNTLYAPAVLVLHRTKDREHSAEVAALRLGTFGLAAMPGEVFVELGREVEAGSPYRPTRTIGLTNGAMGYIPTRKGFTEGGYEAGYRSARYETDTGHRWAEAAVRLLKETAR